MKKEVNKNRTSDLYIPMVDSFLSFIYFKFKKFFQYDRDKQVVTRNNIVGIRDQFNF